MPELRKLLEDKVAHLEVQLKESQDKVKALETRLGGALETVKDKVDKVEKIKMAFLDFQEVMANLED